jgi:hypothetical protein
MKIIRLSNEIIYQIKVFRYTANSEKKNVRLPWFLGPLFPPEDADEDLAFFLSLVFPNSLTTISILIVSMPPTSDKFDPQVSNEETLPLPGPTIKLPC